MAAIISAQDETRSSVDARNLSDCVARARTWMTIGFCTARACSVSTYDGRRLRIRGASSAPLLPPAEAAPPEPAAAAAGLAPCLATSPSPSTSWPVVASRALMRPSIVSPLPAGATCARSDPLSEASAPLLLPSRDEGRLPRVAFFLREAGGGSAAPAE